MLADQYTLLLLQVDQKFTMHTCTNAIDPIQTFNLTFIQPNDQLARAGSHSRASVLSKFFELW